MGQSGDQLRWDSRATSSGGTGPLLVRVFGEEKSDTYFVEVGEDSDIYFAEVGMWIKSGQSTEMPASVEEILPVFYALR